jgi:hypothetical protein
MMWGLDVEIEIILSRAEEAGLSDSDFAALRNEITAARELPPEARVTAIRIALAKYPQTREMVKQLAHDPSMTTALRSGWLGREAWAELDTTQTETDALVSRFLNGQIPASDLNEAAQVVAMKDFLRSGYDATHIMETLDLSPPEYGRILRIIEQDE